MKTPLLISIVIFLASFQNSEAQTWCALGQEWVYMQRNNSGGPLTIDKFSYESDTVIQGINCQIIDHNMRYITGNYPGGTLGISDSVFYRGTELTYSLNDTVFHYQFDKSTVHLFPLPNPIPFDILYCFNAQTYDRWKVSSFLFEGGQENTCDSAYVEVDSVGFLEVNGHTLRWLDVHAYQTSSQGFNGRIVEGYGAVTQNIFPEGQSCSGLYDYSFYLPRCYNHPIYGLYNLPQQDCNIFIGVGLETLQSSKFNIYPNPASDFINIELKGISVESIEIMNVFGKLVQTLNTSGLISVSLSTNELATGIYFIRINVQNGDKSVEKIVVSR